MATVSMDKMTGASAEADQAQLQSIQDAALKDALSSVEGTAKQLTTLSGLISGIYFGAVSFAKMSPGMAPMPNRVLLLVPMALWLGTLLGAVLALAPRTQPFDARTPAQVRELSMRVVGAKQRWLRVSLGCFVVSLLALGAVLWAVVSAGR